MTYVRFVLSVRKTKINNLCFHINNKISRQFQLLENQREKVINKGILSPRDYLSITLNLTVFSVTMPYNLRQGYNVSDMPEFLRLICLKRNADLNSLFQSIPFLLHSLDRPSLQGVLQMVFLPGCRLPDPLLPDRKRIRRECIHICPYLQFGLMLFL